MTPSRAEASVDAAAALDAMAGKLVQVSERRPTRPFARVDFADALDRSRPVMPPELLTLAGHAAFDALDDDARWRLGLLETISFFSLNIHGEQAVVADLVERLYRQRWAGESPAVSRYLQHMIHEENSHTYMLAEYCTRYYGRVMADIPYEHEHPELSRLGADLLLFGRVYVLEVLLHFVNRAALRAETLDPTTRAVHRSHHLDESQHVAFDRVVIAALVQRMRGEGRDDEIGRVAGLCARYGDYAFGQLVNPRVYRELGLPDPLRLAREVQASARWAALKARCAAQQAGLFRKVGMSV